MDSFQDIIQFIRKLYNRMEGDIPLHAPVFNGNERKYINECIESTFVSSVGKYVNQFENAVEEYTVARKAVATVNGTAALHLALLSVGVQPGAEVITQPLTFIATANAISYAGANPVFIDVDKDTLGMSPGKLEHFLKANTYWDRKIFKTINRITKQPISACVPMHTFGHPCRIDEIVSICDNYHIPVVEDAAESMGSFFKGKHTGTYGKIGVLSFNGNKTITTGGGGMILTDDVELGKHIKHLTTQAKIPHPWEFKHDAIGFNYRMPNINAALGLAQMEQLEGFVKNKREKAYQYKDFFSRKNIDFVTEPEDCRSNYWLNAIIFLNRNERDQFLKTTNADGVMTRPIWVPMHQLDMYAKFQCDDLLNVKFISNRLVNLPSSVTPG